MMKMKMLSSIKCFQVFIITTLSLFFFDSLKREKVKLQFGIDEFIGKKRFFLVMAKIRYSLRQ